MNQVQNNFGTEKFYRIFFKFRKICSFFYDKEIFIIVFIFINFNFSIGKTFVLFSFPFQLPWENIGYFNAIEHCISILEIYEKRKVPAVFAELWNFIVLVYRKHLLSTPFFSKFLICFPRMTINVRNNKFSFNKNLSTR